VTENDETPAAGQAELDEIARDPPVGVEISVDTDAAGERHETPPEADVVSLCEEMHWSGERCTLPSHGGHTHHNGNLGWWED